MSITDPNTVLILGAGVSAPFNIPLGGDLITLIRDQINREMKAFDDVKNRASSPRGFLFGIAQRSDLFYRHPILGTIVNSHLLTDGRDFDVEPLNSDFVDLRKLASLLDDQTSETIDDFIVENPSYAHLSKIGIAALFMLSCYRESEGQLDVQTFSKRHFPEFKKDGSNRNWIHLLINIIRHGIRSEAVRPDNKVRIVTFNYDKILEFALSRQFSNTEEKRADYSKYVEILHVHGECGDLTDRITTPAASCLEWAKGIHVVNENKIPEHIKEARVSARNMVQSAREIYACGFSFAGPNCRLLGLGSPKGFDERLIGFCNYDGNIGISKTVAAYKREQTTLFNGVVTPRTFINEVAGTAEKPIGIKDWLKLGSLGELPG